MTSIRKRRRQIARLAKGPARGWINYRACAKFDGRVLQLNVHGDRFIVTTAKGAYALSHRDIGRSKTADFSRRTP
jgi:hypothetical protein